MIDKGEAGWSVLQRKEFWQLLSSWICLTTLLGCSAAAILLLLLLCCNTGWAVQWVQCISRAGAGSASSKPAWSAFLLRTATTVDMKISFTDVNVVHSTFQTYSKLRNSPTQIDFNIWLSISKKLWYIIQQLWVQQPWSHAILCSIYSAVPVVLCLHIVPFGRETQECS